MNIDDDKVIDNNTFYARQRVDRLSKNLDRVKLDPEVENRRKASHECPVCYYLDSGRISGQGFTEYRCEKCKKDHLHPNTSVPRLCGECAEFNRVCRRCGADIDLLDRLSHEKPSAVRRLSDLLRQAGLVVSFDPERDITKPCFSCGGAKAADLVLLRFDGRTVSRPFCQKCIDTKAPKKITERDIDAKTIDRLLRQLSEAYHELWDETGLASSVVSLESRLELARNAFGLVHSAQEHLDGGRIQNAKDMLENCRKDASRVWPAGSKPMEFQVGDVVTITDHRPKAQWWRIEQIHPTDTGKPWFDFSAVKRNGMTNLRRRAFSGGLPESIVLVRRGENRP